ncbi:DNA (cytosine-5)-methyltransferase 3A isoform X2 [Ixodes scapularis]|uniref:DNA (cytosine-5)-methyltransferase 3A isoform X2 n=1 Tax=Ixodes scapularis TaxID=6945 RepID=UPI001A9F70AC|nr:DNA (cytosine-5)-methyltransferase 3A isoform X2 [Ixodes scapularis]
MQQVLAASPWRCYLCSGRAVGLLHCRPDWQQRLLELFRPPGPRCPPPPVPLEEERRPIRVLSLFDGIGTGRFVLDQIGIAVEAYFASEVDQGAINVGITQHGTGISYLGPVESVTDAQIQALCPVDLLLAGSPCNDLSLVNPARKGLYDCSGSGALFFDFHRLLRAVQLANRGHHLFWVYENVAAMPRDCKRTISRFLECEPTLLDARFFSAQVRARYFWGNVPGMYSALPPCILERSVDLSSVLNPLLNRKALVEKIRTVTTRSNSLRQGKQGMLPIQVGERGADVLWITELERVFGFPSHYTDVGNLSLGRRQQLLGRAWSVPVVCHLLGPLKDFFRAGERRPPTQEC